MSVLVTRGLLLRQMWLRGAPAFPVATGLGGAGAPQRRRLGFQGLGFFLHQAVELVFVNKRNIELPDAR
jgi:hypothetical protein